MELSQGVTPISDQGRVSRVLHGMFHSEGGDIPEDNEEEDDEWFDLSDEEPAQKNSHNAA